MKKIITIGREFGSGGHEIGERLSRRLNYSLYDREIIDETAKKSGINVKELQRYDEKAMSSLLYSLFPFSLRLMRRKGLQESRTNMASQKLKP